MPTEKKDEKETQEEPLVPVGEGADAPNETLEEQIAKDDAKDRAEAAAGDEEGDERVGHSEDDEGDAPEGETVEQKRERRRAERKRRNQNNQLMKRELSFLRQRNEQVERQLSQVVLRQGQQDIVQIDTRINDIDRQIRQAEDIHAQAISAGDGKSSAEALRIKDELAEERRRLSGAKSLRDQQTKSQANGDGRPKIDPEIMRHATDWVERNSGWFDPHLKDETSFMAKAIEDRVLAEGRLDPRTAEYWEEVDRRVQKRLPEVKKRMRADDDDDLDLDEDDDRRGRRSREDEDDDDEEVQPRKKEPPKKKGGGPRFPVNGRQRALGKNEVFITKERRAALEQAGLWDDPKTRERYLKSYQTYDKEARDNK